MREHERLQKILSAHGIATRRASESLILEGGVCVNGVTATLGQSVRPDIDEITVDGVSLTGYAEHVYIMLNKPRGYLTTVRDDRGRKTVMELVSVPGVRVYPVGRLDYNSEGLLLFTNDGLFANSVSHPSGGKKKTYEVTVRGDAVKAAKLLSEPVSVDSHLLQAVSVLLITESVDSGVLEITISEGKNRQIRKMCTACGVSVSALKRISVGPVELGSLETGKWRYLTEEEVRSLG